MAEQSAKFSDIAAQLNKRLRHQTGQLVLMAGRGSEVSLMMGTLVADVVSEIEGNTCQLPVEQYAYYSSSSRQIIAELQPGPLICDLGEIYRGLLTVTVGDGEVAQWFSSPRYSDFKDRLRVLWDMALTLGITDRVEDASFDLTEALEEWRKQHISILRGVYLNVLSCPYNEDVVRTAAACLGEAAALGIDPETPIITEPTDLGGIYTYVGGLLKLHKVVPKTQ